MARGRHLFDFKHDGDHIDVFLGDGTKDVYYSKNNGSNTSAGLHYKEDTGKFGTRSGKSIDWAAAQSHVRGLL